MIFHSLSHNPCPSFPDLSGSRVHPIQDIDVKVLAYGTERACRSISAEQSAIKAAALVDSSELPNHFLKN